MTELDRIRERLRQNRTVWRQTIADHARESAGQSRPVATGTLTAGARAFDRVAGEEVEIVAVTRENLVVPITER